MNGFYLSLFLRCDLVAHFFSPIGSRTSSPPCSLTVCSCSVLTLTVDFARPAGLTSFALSLSLFAYFCNLLVCLVCLRMSSRFQYEYTFKSCTCFLCYRPKRDDVFAHCFFLIFFVVFTINHYFVVFLIIFFKLINDRT